MKNLRSALREIGRRLRRDFADHAERDPSRFKQLVLRLLQAELPPKPGRPRLKRVSVALAMRRRGESWRAVYASCVPDEVRGDSRQLAQARLRAAVRARLLRQRRMR